MKLIRIFAAAALAALTAFAVAQNAMSPMMSETPLQPAMAVSGRTLQQANFYTIEAPTAGTLQIVESANGERTLILRNFKTEVGPDLKVWFTNVANPTKANAASVKTSKYAQVAIFKGAFNGNFEAKLPKDLDISQYRSVVIWCNQANAAFGAAVLK